MNRRCHARVHTLSNAYRSLALVVLNALLLFAFLNFGAATALRLASATGKRAPNPEPLFLPDGAPVDTGRRMPYHLDWFDVNACQTVDQATMGAVLDDFFDLARLGFTYEPWCQFTEPPFDGDRVHVAKDASGNPIRATVQPSAPAHHPQVTIYCFGGSTTFGYHVADEHTWPSYLARVLHQHAHDQGLAIDVQVANYGRGIYYPSQELALFLELLRAGRRPNLAIFLDGVNLGPEADTPRFTAACARAFHAMQGTDAKEARFPWECLPLVRWVGNTLTRGQDARWTDSRAARPAAHSGGLSREERAAQVCRCFRTNWRHAQAVASAEGIETLICLQPDAIHDYPLELYRVPLPAEYAQSREVRQLVHAAFKQDWPEGVVDLTALFTLYGPERKAVLDDCHYTPDFNRFLAEQIAARIDLVSLAKPGAPAAQPAGSGPALGSSDRPMGASSISR